MQIVFMVMFFGKATNILGKQYKCRKNTIQLNKAFGIEYKSGGILQGKFNTADSKTFGVCFLDEVTARMT